MNSATPEIALLSPRAHVRRHAARTATDALALAHTALFDDDAHVRATAALRVRDVAILCECALDAAPLVRAAALRSLRCAHDSSEAIATLATAVSCEPVWWARRRAVQSLAPFLAHSDAADALAVALGDPFWRVRHAAVRVMLRALASDSPVRDVVEAIVDRAPASEAHAAALAYVARRRPGAGAGAIGVPQRAHERELVPDAQPFRIEGALFDPDPAVMTARLERADWRERFHVDGHTLVLLLADPHEPLRAIALSRLLHDVRDERERRASLRLALTWLEDPRVPHASDTALRLLDRAGAAARSIARDVLDDDVAHPRVLAWASSYAHRTRDVELLAHSRVLAPPERERVALPDDDVRGARAAARRDSIDGADLGALEHSADPALRARAAQTCTDVRVALRLLHDRASGVRAWARGRIDDAAAQRHLDDDDDAVRAGARAFLGVATPRAELARPAHVEPHVTRAPAIARALGRTGITLPPVVVSGANDLPDAALARAAAMGASAYFWEPRYLSLTRFLRARTDLVVVAGSYDGSAAGIARDVAQALDALARPCVDVFLLFWARSTERLARESFDALEREKRAGRIRAHGFSTHLRELALSAIDEHAWDVVMTRHSAAHPGAEDALFPACAQRGVGVLSFSATSYGRLLRAPVTARDCYAYSLAQPGVCAVLSAPRYARELDDNCALLHDVTLADDARARLLDVGRAVRSESKDLAALVRRAPLAPAPAREVDAALDEEVP